MNIAVLVAMDREFDKFSRLIPAIEADGRLGGHKILLAKCGIGKVNSAIGALKLIQDCAPDCIISSGCAGGIGKGVRTMDVVVASECVYHDVWCGMGCEYGQIQGLPTRFASDEGLLRKAMEAAGAELDRSVHAGLICSGDRFVSSRQEEDEILSHFPEALAVDMESCSIAQVCHIQSVPFLSIRVISDSASDDHESEYNDFWETVADTSFSFVTKVLENL